MQTETVEAEGAIAPRPVPIPIMTTQQRADRIFAALRSARDETDPAD